MIRFLLDLLGFFALVLLIGLGTVISLLSLDINRKRKRH